MKKIQALAMFSGGLDSILAIKMIKDQGIEVEALKVISPFYQNEAAWDDFLFSNTFTTHSLQQLLHIPYLLIAGGLIGVNKRCAVLVI